MTLKILKYPDPILKKKCTEVKEITPEIKKIIQDMIETLKGGEGIGLAASQVGRSERIVVVLTSTGPKALINPKIIKKTKETDVLEEGCLSFPGLFLKIKRPKGVEVEALDEEGKIFKIKTEEIPAFVFQHEIDHLDGILFIDRLPFWQRFKIKKKLKNF